MERAQRVLIVDDDEPVRDLLWLAFELDGFDVATAPDGLEAIVQAEVFEPDVVVLDLAMPRMDGLAALGHLRRQSEPVPVVVVSARSESADISAGLSAGADDYVTKPFDTEDLVARTRRVAAARRSGVDPAGEPAVEPALSSAVAPGGLSALGSLAAAAGWLPPQATPGTTVPTQLRFPNGPPAASPRPGGPPARRWWALVLVLVVVAVVLLGAVLIGGLRGTG